MKNIEFFLVYESESFPNNVDAIVVLGGGTGNRVDTALSFYNESNSKYLIMTAGPLFDNSFAQLMKDYAINNGAAESSIILEEKSLSTKDHPIYLDTVFKKYDCKKVVIVTSKFHTKRSYETFLNYYRNSDISFYMLSAPDKIDYSRWYKNHESAEKVLIELSKRFVYKLIFLFN